jgi:hypothetical protein
MVSFMLTSLKHSNDNNTLSSSKRSVHRMQIKFV